MLVESKVLVLTIFLFLSFCVAHSNVIQISQAVFASGKEYCKAPIFKCINNVSGEVQ